MRSNPSVGFGQETVKGSPLAFFDRLNLLGQQKIELLFVGRHGYSGSGGTIIFA
jgi:hypothetical protein